jgi:hypothetical protein
MLVSFQISGVAGELAEMLIVPGPAAAAAGQRQQKEPLLHEEDMLWLALRRSWATSTMSRSAASTRCCRSVTPHAYL